MIYQKNFDGKDEIMQSEKQKIMNNNKINTRYH